jgi:PAS domain S-box-containing protein
MIQRTDKKEIFHYLENVFFDLEQQKMALDESAIVAITDTKGNITYVNDKFCEISKYNREELIGQNHRIVNSGYHSSDFFIDLWKTLGAGKVWKGDIKNRAKDGSYYWVSTTIVPYLTEDGKPYQFIAIRFDITKQKDGEEALKQQKIALDDSAIVAITDTRGIITYVNDKFCEISKYSREELIGQNHRIINSGHHSKDFFVDIWQTIGQGKVWKGDIKNRAKDGQFYWVSTSIVPYLNESGKPYQYVAIRFDITKQKELENDLKERTRQLEDFCFIVSHNLRAPLSNLLLLTSMIEESTTFEDQKLLSGKLSKPVNVLNETFNELVESLQVKKDIHIEKEELLLEDCFSKVMDVLNVEVDSADHEIRSDFKNLPTLFYPRKYLHSYLHNLISNALRYRSRDRKLLIDVNAYEKEGVQFLEVRDNGLGIDLAANGKKLFGLRKTFHGNPDAKGFGLFITKTQVETLGGTIKVESELGKGSIFVIKFNKAPVNEKI